MREYIYKTVIFDMDGTILDTLEDLTDTLNYALRKNDMPLRTLSEVRSFVGNGIQVLLNKAIPDGNLNPKYDDVYQSFKEYYKDHCNDKTHAYPGILELMRTLKQDGVRMAIVSNKVNSAVEELNEVYFEGMVDVAMGEHSGMARKPAPDMVFAAMEKLNADPTTTVYIGDSDVDYNTAKNASLPCISVLWGFRTKEQLESVGATVFAEKAEDILTLIRK